MTMGGQSLPCTIVSCVDVLQDNLTLFQNCCRDVFGLQECQLFDIRDLDDLRLRVVVECVFYYCDGRVRLSVCHTPSCI